MKKALYFWLLMNVFFVSSHSVAASKTIGIIVFDGVLSSDVTAPLEVFGVASKLSWFNDYNVVTISVNKQAFITTEEGLKLGTDTWIGAQPQLDVLIVPSSYSMTPLIKNTQLINFIQSQSTHLDWIASNCSGSSLLAEAGILNGLKATTWAGGEKDFQKNYPHVNVQINTNVVVDKHVVTSNGSIVSYQAALTLLRLMSSKNKAHEVADAIQFTRLSQHMF
jgi:transcriptional regulator GlxA family with amidase domain